MTHTEAENLRSEYLHLKGRSYSDLRKKQVDTVLDIVVTPQDHPFYPEFVLLYKETGSYTKASGLIFEKHGNEIIYAVKCVLDELYDVENDLNMHVLANLQEVLRYI